MPLHGELGTMQPILIGHYHCSGCRIANAYETAYPLVYLSMSLPSHLSPMSDHQRSEIHDGCTAPDPPVRTTLKLERPAQYLAFEPGD